MMTSSYYWTLFGAFTAGSTVLVIFWLVVLPRLSRRWRATRRREFVAEEYERLVEIRQEAVYHFYWAIERKDFKEADAHEASVLEIDGRLNSLKQDYLSIN
jgi:hypothetical protein